MDQKTPSPATLLRASLSELEESWLELSCCKGLTHYPLRLLAERCGGDLPLRDILGRLRCKRCRGRPAEVIVAQTGLTVGAGVIFPRSAV